MGKGHLNFALGAGALSVMHFLLCTFCYALYVLSRYKHINFRNGAGILYFAMYFFRPQGATFILIFQ